MQAAAGSRRHAEDCARNLFRSLAQTNAVSWMRTLPNHLEQVGRSIGALQLGVIHSSTSDDPPVIWYSDPAHTPALGVHPAAGVIPAVQRSDMPDLSRPNPTLRKRIYYHADTNSTTIALRLSDADQSVTIWATLRAKPLRDRYSIWLVWILAEICITARIRAHNHMQLQHNEARYQLLTTHSTDLISVHDHQGVIQYCSPACIEMLGYQPEELIGRSPADFIHPDDQLAALQRGILQSSGAVTTMFRLRHRDGYDLWVEAAVRLVCDPSDGAIREIVAISRDIETRRNFEAQIEHISSHDSLTKLVNRRRFQELVERSLVDILHTQRELAIFSLDLDQFKKVNDSLGHGAGDELLIQVTERIRAILDPDDQVARLGGDEFALLLPYQPGERPIETLALRLIDQIRVPFLIRKRRIYIGASIGIAYAPQHGNGFEELLQHADIAMYHAKIEGNRYQVFNPKLSADVQQRLQIESDLRSAIDDGQLRLYYQPIQSLQSNRMVAVEALVRWQHPELGLLLPGHFVPIAESSDLIRDLDREVIRLALLQLRDWIRQGHPIVVAVNLSVRTLHDPSLPEYVHTCLRACNVPPELLTLEITESTAMSAIHLTINVLNELRAAGMRVAIDDFGSGHSSLNYLRTLPIDYVKIDRDFVTNITHVPYDEAVVRAVVALGAGLQVPVVAEGVEHQQQMDLLRAIGCTMVQGFGIGRPVPPEMLHFPPPLQHAAD